MTFSSLLTRGRGILVALALGATAITAMPAPAMAQSFNFDFQINGGGSDFSWGYDRRGKRYKRECLSDNEVRRAIRRMDFENIEFVDRRGRRVVVIAEYDPNNKWYKLTVNKCTGSVDIERVRNRDYDDDDDGHRRGRGRDRDRDDDIVLY